MWGVGRFRWRPSNALGRVLRIGAPGPSRTGTSLRILRLPRCGARGRTRTDIPLRMRDFESRASTSSTTRACHCAVALLQPLPRACKVFCAAWGGLASLADGARILFRFRRLKRAQALEGRGSCNPRLYGGRPAWWPSVTPRCDFRAWHTKRPAAICIAEQAVGQMAGLSGAAIYEGERICRTSPH